MLRCALFRNLTKTKKIKEYKTSICNLSCFRQILHILFLHYNDTECNEKTATTDNNNNNCDDDDDVAQNDVRKGGENFLLLMLLLMLH